MPIWNFPIRSLAVWANEFRCHIRANDGPRSRQRGYVKCYICDVVIHSSSIEKHIGHIENVLKLLRENGLGLRLKKCFLMQPRVELLGRFVDAEEVHVDEDKVSKIKYADPPSNRKVLRSFLGLESNFAKIANHLTEKTSEKVPFE